MYTFSLLSLCHCFIFIKLPISLLSHPHTSSFLSVLAYFLKDFLNFIWKLYFLFQKQEHMVIYFKNLLFLIHLCDHSAFIAQNIFDNIRLENKVLIEGHLMLALEPILPGYQIEHFSDPLCKQHL